VPAFVTQDCSSRRDGAVSRGSRVSTHGRHPLEGFIVTTHIDGKVNAGSMERRQVREPVEVVAPKLLNCGSKIRNPSP